MPWLLVVLEILQTFVSYRAKRHFFQENYVMISPGEQEAGTIFAWMHAERRRLEKMGFGLVDIRKEDREKKYDVYVEEYVLSYLKREADSLELSEIYFYGQREKDGSKIYVYGAGRKKEIAAFAEYEPLEELVCRLTQAGPVFMVRESDGSCKVTGFQVFYENNEAMQNYLIEWTSSGDKNRAKEVNAVEDTPVLPVAVEGMKRHLPHSAISVQLCLILVVLVAIVISSTDSYEKMEQLNQSAREVFFAIENQETEGTAETSGGQTEILVERETEEERELVQDETDILGVEREEEEQAEDMKKESSGQSSTEEKDTAKVEEAPLDSTEEQEKEAALEKQDVEERSDEENEEALSRSITRYYEVEQGDTLYTISQEIYGDISRVEKICEINQISDPDKIRSGQKIILP